MLRFFFTSKPNHPGRLVTQALVGRGLPAELDPATLSVVQQRGSYSGRRVTYFRVFDPARNTGRSIGIRGYTDLDACPELVVAFGHIEQDGAVVLSKRDGTHAPVTTERHGADRSAHTDDEAIIFPTRTP
jgi:hypothetical protein